MIALILATIALLAVAIVTVATAMPARWQPSPRRLRLQIDREAFRAETQIDWAVSNAVEEMLAAARAAERDDPGSGGSGPLSLGG